MKQLPILLATTNQDKQRELRRLVEGLALSPVTPAELGLDSAPEEDEETHLEIARQKACQWSQTASTLAMASDGGLVLPALGDRWESLFTHRFAGEPADDQTRVQRLLELMLPYRGTRREASWIEALAIADRGRLLASWELTGATGIIAEDATELLPDGSGFWVFSLWEFPQYGKRYNQLSTAQREALNDHWLALRGLVQRYFRAHFVTPVA